MSRTSLKTEVIARLFAARWDESSGTLSRAQVTLTEVQTAIQEVNAAHPDKTPLSDKNPANFLKDIVRNRNSANRHWPATVLTHGYTGEQRVGGGYSFEFIRIEEGQTLPFPAANAFGPTALTPRHEVESISLPLASRRLGRDDEPWLIQVLVRQRVLETHFSLHSPLRIVQFDHLQMGVKLNRTEIDALFLAIEKLDPPGGGYDEIIVTCEAKGLRDDILPRQIKEQVKAVFRLHGVTQERAIPVAVKAIGTSEVYVVEFQPIAKSEALDEISLVLASEAMLPVPTAHSRHRVGAATTTWYAATQPALK